MSIQSQQPAKPYHQGINPMSTQCQSNANPVPIWCQSDANPSSIHIHSSKSTNKYTSSSHLHQSANSFTIFDQSSPILDNCSQSTSIRTDVSGLPEGTSTVGDRPKCLDLGRFRQSIITWHSNLPHRQWIDHKLAQIMPILDQCVFDPPLT